MNRKNRILSILLILNLIWAVSYYSDIQPVFNQYCTSCHQGENFASGGLDLTSYEYLMNGGDSGQSVNSGDHENSILWQRVENGDMPAEETDFGQEEINMIADWIDSGTRVCDDGFAYHPEIADSLETEYINITIQDQEYNPCFYEADLEALEDIISENNFENTDPFKLGTQTWNTGRLRFLVAGYYFSGVEEIIHTIPESIGQLDDLRSLYLEWNQIETLPDSFTNLTRLVNLYISNNQLTSLPENFGNLESYPEKNKTKKNIQIFNVANISADGEHLNESDPRVVLQKNNSRWHTDSSYRFYPALYSLLFYLTYFKPSTFNAEQCKSLDIVYIKWVALSKLIIRIFHMLKIICLVSYCSSISNRLH